MKTSEIEHFACKYIIFVIGSDATLVGFDPGLEIFMIIMVKYESSLWVTWRQ